MKNRMNFSIYTLNDSGSGIEYTTKSAFLAELSAMIDDCIANGGTYFSISVDADASCFCNEDDECDDDDDVLYLEIADLLEYDSLTGDCKVSKDIFDCFTRNAYVQIHFDDGVGIRNYFMASEDEDGIFMKSIEE